MGPLITTETAEGPGFEDWGLGPQGQIGEHTRKLGREPASLKLGLTESDRQEATNQGHKQEAGKAVWPCKVGRTRSVGVVGDWNQACRNDTS